MNTSLESLLISTFKKHTWIVLATFISTISASILYLAIAPSQYKTSAKLIVGEQEVSVSNLGQQLTEKATKTPGKIADPVATQAELVKSNKVLRRALKSFQQETGISDENLLPIRKLQENIDVEILPATNILKLVYHYPNPEVAAKLLNHVARSVVEENIETNRSQANALREFLEVKISQQQSKLQQAEIAESEYRQAQGLVNFEAQTASLVNSLTELENEERILLARLREITSTRDTLKQAAGLNNLDQAYTVLRISQDEELLNLRSKLVELEADIMSHRSYLTDNAPELQKFVLERDNVRALYEGKLSRIFANNKAPISDNATFNKYDRDLISSYVSSQIEYNALENKLKTIRTELQDLQTRVARIPVSQKPLAELIRQRQAAEASLKLLQSKLEEAKIAESQSTSTISIASFAEIDTIPISPKPAAVLVIGTTAGIFLSMGTVFLLTLIDDTIHDASEAKKTLDFPIFGVLPNIFADVLGVPNLNQFLDNAENRVFF